MGISYAPGKYNAAAGTRDAFAALAADLEAEGLPGMVVADADREEADQWRIWNDRMTLTPNGRKVYGTRVWQGKTWYQIHPDTVAPPGTGNHEKRRSNDLKWPYNSDTAAHRRAQVLAKRHNITCEGMGFREWWHWTFWGPLGTITLPAGNGNTASRPTITPEVRMDHIKIVDGGGFRHAITNGYEFQQGELNDAGGLGVLWTELYGAPRVVSGAAWKEAQRIAKLFTTVRANSVKTAS